ncbi:sugar isomerase domain-containing protein [Arthrobacter bambusae]|uniref:Phosphosugar-binding protein n=1 Tax=Arthrobacter bambusae TaxID=1338426 RepID=A0AAW8DD18_9MICC|nr:sugar isomerase domain-containing protein [Arthrobacter bambusae]MDP9906232.1 putative phosphosugar-binding protein [Arthrobacter bambusae]MDQ0130535.1 putative phosphosugar-binding protein [Arthrobacter bambusae]MDQ0182210.1 putative phosphosugar-binding protein [Arthrobacter bambusae]
MNSREQLSGDYLGRITELLGRIRLEEAENISVAADILAAQVAKDELVHIYGPGGHSNLASQEVFFRAGGLMHVSAILDEGTLLSGGALRSMAMERTPGYGRIVIEDAGLGPGDALILVNAYGINSALIDAALTARELSVTTIGVSSREHAEETAGDHPARHPQKLNLHDVVDHHIDTKVPVGDAVMEVPGAKEKTAAVSTFANAFTLDWLMMSTIGKLNEIGTEPPLWRSGNAPGGDEANQQFISRFKGRVHKL